MLITNRKSCMSFRLVTKSGDLEWSIERRKGHYTALNRSLLLLISLNLVNTLPNTTTSTCSGIARMPIVVRVRCRRTFAISSPDELIVEPELLLIEVYIEGIGILDHFCCDRLTVDELYIRT